MAIDPATSTPRDEIVRTVSSAGGVAVRAMVGTALVADAASRHATSPTASAALGRALMGAVLLGAGTKDGETVQLQLRGDGPLGSVAAIADSDGRVRGYAANPAAHPPPRDGLLDVSAAVGRGVLAVVRNRPGWREPYRGIVPLVSGTVAQDIADYLARSEQTRSAVALGVFLDGDGGVEAAGGYFVDALPGASAEEVDRVERNVHDGPGPGELVRSGFGAEDIALSLLEGVGARSLVRGRPVFHCPCDRERVLRTIVLLGRKEVHRTAARGESLEVRCEFCGERYTIGSDEIGALLPDA